MFNRKNFTKDTMNKIKVRMTKTIPDEIANGISVDDYMTKCRVPLNLEILEVIFGAKLENLDKSGNVKVDKKTNIPVTSFNQPLPTLADLSNLVAMLNNFIIKVEQPFLSGAGYGAECFTTGEDDMSIPCVSEAPLPQLGKYSHKKMNEFIFNDMNGLGRRIITGMDILPLASIAEKARKAKNLHTMLIIGGVALVITGTVVAIHVMNKNDEEKNDMANTDAIDLSAAEEIDMTEAEEIDMTEAEDLPVVELDAE